MLRIRIAWLLLFASLAAAQSRTNDPAGVEVFRDRGLGLFIHWSIDGSLGGVISHSLVGASQDYVERFYRLLPEHFNPDRFDPVTSAGWDRLYSRLLDGVGRRGGICMSAGELSSHSTWSKYRSARRVGRTRVPSSASSTSS